MTGSQKHFKLPYKHFPHSLLPSPISGEKVPEGRMRGSCTGVFRKSCAYEFAERGRGGASVKKGGSAASG
jgi:hypothetical protein